MDTNVLAAFISAIAAIGIAAISYVLTKKAEREAEWRKFKLGHYKEYVMAVSGICGRRSASASAGTRYADAANALTLVASPAVLQAFFDYQDEINGSNTNKSKTKHDELWTKLLKEIRRDVHPVAPDDGPISFWLIDAPTPAPDIDRQP